MSERKAPTSLSSPRRQDRKRSSRLFPVLPLLVLALCLAGGALLRNRLSLSPAQTGRTAADVRASNRISSDVLPKGSAEKLRRSEKKADSSRKNQDAKTEKRAREQGESSVAGTAPTKTGLRSFEELSSENRERLRRRCLDDKVRAALETVRAGARYTSRNEVAAYLLLFEELPPNYHPKRDRGEACSEENPDLPCMIGGDVFGNYEGKLPEKKGRSYREADLDDSEEKRGAARLVFSNDGLIFYTGDHYRSFLRLCEGETPPKEKRQN